MRNFFNLALLSLPSAILPGFVVSTILPAQPNLEWQKSLGGSEAEQARSIVETSDEGLVVVGYSVSNNGDVIGNHGVNDFWAVKLNNMGIIEWKKTFGGSNDDWAYSIQKSNDGGFIVAGYTKSNDGNVSGNHGDRDFWVIKLNDLGNLQWQKTYGGSSWDEAWSAQQTSDGGYIVAGRSVSVDGDVTGGHGAFDFWVIKLDGTGALQWQKSLGGSMDDIAYSVRQTKDGGYILAGESESNDGDASGLHGSTDYWVVKLDSSGQIQWQRMYGSSSLDRANDIYPTNDGGYIVIGLSSWNDGDVTGNHGGFDIWAVKLDSLGAIQWQKSLGGSKEDYGQSVQQISDGGYIIAGSSPSTDGDVLGNDGGVDFWVVRLTPEGELKWQKTLGGGQADRAYSVQQTSDSGFIVAGYTQSTGGDVSGFHGVQDYWVVKLSPESVGIPESAVSAASLEIYPNPASQTIALQSTALEGERFILSVSDFLGRELLQRKDLMPSAPVDISSLPTGIYLLTARTDAGKVLSGKFRKQD